MELNFGFKKEREEVTEKYPDLPVLTFISEGGVTKFSLNKKAIEMLNINENGNKLNYGLTSTDQMFLANTSGQEEKNLFNVNKDNTLNNRALLLRMNKEFNTKIELNQEFVLSTVDQDFGFPILLINNESPNSKTEDDFSEFPDDAFAEVTETANEGEIIENAMIQSQQERDFNSQVEY